MPEERETVQNGKGSRQRPSRIKKSEYDKKFDKIFKKKDKK